MSDVPILVLAGATASGKTATALALARRLGGELVGADSVQVYRGFDVGSAKPTPEELGEVTHHLLDVLEPDEAIDAMAYARLADSAIAETRARGHVPIVVGGTGLWLRALVRGLVDLPPVDPSIRRALEEEAERRGSAFLHARLAEVDPRAAAAIHPNDALRIVRALEVYEQTGTALGELRAAHALGAPRYRALFLVLDVPLDELSRRIERRLDAMIANGFVDEVRSLRERHGDDVRAFGSVGYRQILEHLRDGIPWEITREALRVATRTYARRQRNWFRAEPGIDARVAPDELLLASWAARFEEHLGR